MGHSQSYDLRNPEPDEKDPVRGVRRVNKEHQTDISGIETEHFDYREDELRERIRREQLKKREDELETLRIRQHESREPIIDAYRTTPQSSPSSVYTEFNYYDSLKHRTPVDPTTYFVLRPLKDINEGHIIPFEPTVTPTPRYVPPGGTYSRRTVVTTYTYSSKGSPPPPPPSAQYDTVPDESPTRVIPVATVPSYSNLDLEDEVPRVPLNQQVKERQYVPYPKDTVAPSPKIYRTKEYVNIEREAPKGTKSETYYYSTPSYSNPEPLEMTRLAGEEARIPLSNVVVVKDPVPYKSYSSPSYSNPSYSTPKPLDKTLLVSEEPRTPLSHVVAVKDSVPYQSYSNPSYSNPTPLEKTLLASEVSRIPLDHSVAVKDPVPYKSYSTPVVFRKLPPQETTQLYQEVPRTPPDHHVSKDPVPTVVYRNPQETTQLQTEVPGTPLGHHVDKPPSYSIYSTPTVTSELHVEKRMRVDIEPEPEPQNHVTYVSVVTDATSSIDNLEPLHKHPEVANRPVAVRPSQSSYTVAPIITPRHHQHTQYSRRPSEDVILEQQKKKTCNVENCTHVEVRDSPIVPKRRVSEEVKEKENNLKIYIAENKMENVIDLARDEDVGPMTTTSRRCFEEKLHYNSYFPTMSLGRRPAVSFYDKLH